MGGTGADGDGCWGRRVVGGALRPLRVRVAGAGQAGILPPFIAVTLGRPSATASSTSILSSMRLDRFLGQELRLDARQLHEDRGQPLEILQFLGLVRSAGRAGLDLEEDLFGDVGLGQHRPHGAGADDLLDRLLVHVEQQDLPGGAGDRRERLVDVVDRRRRSPKPWPRPRCCSRSRSRRRCRRGRPPDRRPRAADPGRSG